MKEAFIFSESSLFQAERPWFPQSLFVSFAATPSHVNSSQHLFQLFSAKKGITRVFFCFTTLHYYLKIQPQPCGVILGLLHSSSYSCSFLFWNYRDATQVHPAACWIPVTTLDEK